MASVLFDCERMKNPNTGLFHFCLNLGRQLLTHKKESDSVVFFGPHRLPDIFGPDGRYVFKTALHDVRRPFSNGYNIGPASSKFDLWHMTHQSSRYKPTQKKTVLTIHDLNFLYDDQGVSRRNKYLHIVQDRIDRADHIVCISNYCREDVLKNLHTRSKPVSVVYNGCNINLSDDVENATYAPSRPFLFAIGTVLPKKNFHVLPCLLPDYPGELLIAGQPDSKYAGKILEEAARYNVTDRVKLIGAVSEEEKNWYYRNCEAFLFPSIAEGFGLPVLEAMSHGKPVFLSTCTSLPEIGGPHAYYFESFDPQTMREAFWNGLRDFNDFGRETSIRQWALQFNWGKAAAEYWNIYHSLL